jgi:hypothetical protein
MTDTSTEPAAPADPAQSQRGRPSKVVQRDLAVARTLAEEERSLHAVMAALGLEWRVTYNSVCRLRERGLAELHRNGTRTPTWRLTERGVVWLGAATSDGGPPPPPVPTAEAPPAPPDEAPPPPVDVPTEPEPGAVPVPIEAPEPTAPEEPFADVPPVPAPVPDQPGTVAPAPGPAEPVWPV